MSCLKIAHRGASGHAPENTFLSMRKGFELGAGAIECDVQICKSGEPVIIHDATVKRTTNATGKVADYTLAELSKLDAGEGERIPTLEEYLEALGNHTIFIELKSMECAKPVADVVTKFAEKNGYEKMIVISFLWNALLEIRKLNPNILIGASPKEKRVPARFIQRAAAAGMWSINPCIDGLTEKAVDDAQLLGLKVMTWTANSPEQIAKAKALGVDGIMSDFPERL